MEGMGFSATLGHRLRIPENLTEYMEQLAKEIIRNRPQNMHVFAASFFADLMELREAKRGDSPPLDAPVRRNVTTPPKPIQLPLSESPHDDQPRPLQANIDLPAIDEESPIDAPTQLPVFLTVTKRKSTPEPPSESPKIDGSKPFEDDVSQSEKSRDNSFFTPTYKDGFQEDEQYDEITDFKAKEECLRKDEEHFEKDKEEFFNEVDQLAATKIQASYRGFRTRRALATGAAVAGAVGIGFFPLKEERKEADETPSTSTLAIVPEIPACESPTVSFKDSNRDSAEPRSVNGYYLLKDGAEASASDLNLPESSAYQVSEPDEGKTQDLEEIMTLEPGEDTDPLLRDESDDEATENQCGNLIDFGVDVEDDSNPTEVVNERKDGEPEEVQESAIMPVRLLNPEVSPVHENKQELESEESVPVILEEVTKPVPAVVILERASDEDSVSRDEIKSEVQNPPNLIQKTETPFDEVAESNMESKESEKVVVKEMNAEDDSTDLPNDDIKGDVANVKEEKERKETLDLQESKNQDASGGPFETNDNCNGNMTSFGITPDEVSRSETAVIEEPKAIIEDFETVEESCRTTSKENETELDKADLSLEIEAEGEKSKRDMQHFISRDYSMDLYEVNSASVEKYVEEPESAQESLSVVNSQTAEAIVPGFDSQFLNAVSTHKSFDGMGETLEEAEDIVVDEIERNEELLIVPIVPTESTMDVDDSGVVTADEARLTEEEAQTMIETSDAPKIVDGKELFPPRVEHETDNEIEIIIQKSMDLDDEIASVILSALSDDNSQRSSRAVSKEASFAAVEELEADASPKTTSQLRARCAEEVGITVLEGISGTQDQMSDIVCNTEIDNTFAKSRTALDSPARDDPLNTAEKDLQLVESQPEEANELENKVVLTPIAERDTTEEQLSTQIVAIEPRMGDTGVENSEDAEEKEINVQVVTTVVETVADMSDIPAPSDSSYEEQPKSAGSIDLIPSVYKESSGSSINDSSLVTTTEGVACDRSLTEVEVDDEESMEPGMDGKISEDQDVADMQSEDSRRFSGDLINTTFSADANDQLESHIHDESMTKLATESVTDNKEQEFSSHDVAEVPGLNPIGITITADDVDEDNYIWRKLQGNLSVDEEDIYCKAATKIQATYRGYCTRKFLRDTTPDTQVTDLSDDDRHRDVLNDIENSGDIIIEENAVYEDISVDLVQTSPDTKEEGNLNDHHDCPLPHDMDSISAAIAAPEASNCQEPVSFFGTTVFDKVEDNEEQALKEVAKTYDERCSPPSCDVFTPPVILKTAKSSEQIAESKEGEKVEFQDIDEINDDDLDTKQESDVIAVSSDFVSPSVVSGISEPFDLVETEIPVDQGEDEAESSEEIAESKEGEKVDFQEIDETNDDDLDTKQESDVIAVSCDFVSPSVVSGISEPFDLVETEIPVDQGEDEAESSEEIAESKEGEKVDFQEIDETNDDDLDTKQESDVIAVSCDFVSPSVVSGISEPFDLVETEIPVDQGEDEAESSEEIAESKEGEKVDFQEIDETNDDDLDTKQESDVIAVPCDFVSPSVVSGISEPFDLVETEIPVDQGEDEAESSEEIAESKEGEKVDFQEIYETNDDDLDTKQESDVIAVSFDFVSPSVVSGIIKPSDVEETEIPVKQDEDKAESSEEIAESKEGEKVEFQEIDETNDGDLETKQESDVIAVSCDFVSPSVVSGISEPFDLVETEIPVDQGEDKAESSEEIAESKEGEKVEFQEIDETNDDDLDTKQESDVIAVSFDFVSPSVVSGIIKPSDVEETEIPVKQDEETETNFQNMDVEAENENGKENDGSVDIAEANNLVEEKKALYEVYDSVTSSVKLGAAELSQTDLKHHVENSDQVLDESNVMAFESLSHASVPAVQNADQIVQELEEQAGEVLLGECNEPCKSIAVSDSVGQEVELKEDEDKKIDGNSIEPVLLDMPTVEVNNEEEIVNEETPVDQMANSSVETDVPIAVSCDFLHPSLISEANHPSNSSLTDTAIEEMEAPEETPGEQLARNFVEEYMSIDVLRDLEFPSVLRGPIHTADSSDVERLSLIQGEDQEDDARGRDLSLEELSEHIKPTVEDDKERVDEVLVTAASEVVNLCGSLFFGEMEQIPCIESSDQKNEIAGSDRGSEESNASLQTIVPCLESVNHTSEEHSSNLKNEFDADLAATKIQARFRGYIVRKNINEFKGFSSEQGQEVDIENGDAGEEGYTEEIQLIADADAFNDTLQYREDLVATTGYQVRETLDAGPQHSVDEIEEDLDREQIIKEKFIEEEGSENLEIEDAAATKIQAFFRGHQVRKNMAELGIPKNISEIYDELAVQEEAIELQEEVMEQVNDLSSSFFNNEDAAATKIQAVFRGHQVRKNRNDRQTLADDIGTSDDEFRGQAEEQLLKMTNDDVLERSQQETDNLTLVEHSTENGAAIKIQAVFRGHQVRKNLIEQAQEAQSDEAVLCDSDKPENEVYHAEPVCRIESAVEDDEEEPTDIETAAATKIQAVFRGHCVRKNMTDFQNVTMEREDEGSDSELMVQDLSHPVPDEESMTNEDKEAEAQTYPEDEKAEAAAVTIQAAFRAYQARKTSPLFEDAYEQKEIPVIEMSNGFGPENGQEIYGATVVEMDIPELEADFLLTTHDRSREGSSSSRTTPELSEDEAARRIQEAYRSLRSLRISREPSPANLELNQVVTEKMSEEDAAKKIQEKFRSLRNRRKRTPETEAREIIQGCQDNEALPLKEVAVSAFGDSQQEKKVELDGLVETKDNDVDIVHENDDKSVEIIKAVAEGYEQSRGAVHAIFDELVSLEPESMIPDSLEPPFIRRDSGTPIDSLELVPAHLLNDLGPFAGVESGTVDFDPDSLSTDERMHTDSLDLLKEMAQKQEKILEEEVLPVNSLISDLSESELRPSEISDFLRDIDAERFPQENRPPIDLLALDGTDEASSVHSNGLEDFLKAEEMISEIEGDAVENPNIVHEEAPSMVKDDQLSAEEPALNMSMVEAEVDSQSKECVEEVADEKSDREELIAKEASEIADSIAKAIEEVEFIANSHESPVYKKPDQAEIAKFNESMEEFEIDELDVQGDTEHSSDWSDAEMNLEEISGEILNHAATKIQAQYRGYKTRQMLKRQKYLQNHHHQNSGARNDSSSTTKSTNSRVPELHGFVDCDELQNAATKIQAGVRGFLVRRAMRKLREGRRNSGAREGIYACVRRGSRRHSDVIPRQSSGPPLRRWDPSEFTRQLDSMHEVVAATIIQAYFRGYRARKHLGKVTRKTKSLDRFSFAPSNLENLAATKIQAAFRGYKTRKTLNVSPRTSRPHSALSTASDGNNQDKEKAATKIQANFRGHRVRQQLRKKASDDLNCP